MDGGHDLCPRLLGVKHLRDALTDPCINCGILPLSVREDRLRQVVGDEVPSSRVPVRISATCTQWKKRRAGPVAPKPRKARELKAIHQEVEGLWAEVEKLKTLVQAPPPPPMRCQ